MSETVFDVAYRSNRMNARYKMYININLAIWCRYSKGEQAFLTYGRLPNIDLLGRHYILVNLSLSDFSTIFGDALSTP